LGVKATLYTLQKDGKRILATADNRVFEVHTQSFHPLYVIIAQKSSWEENMSKTATIRKEERILADFERLSKKRKKEVADFVAYLKVKEEIEATKEIIGDKDFLKSIMEGDEDFRAGRFKKWPEVKENV
jgi:hypothetical protein